MEIGCGARVRDFDGRRYFYFWHYERDDGHFREEGGLRRPGGLGEREIRSPASDGRLPPEGGGGVRTTAARIEALVAAHTST
jgi:hypothetical protein